MKNSFFKKNSQNPFCSKNKTFSFYLKTHFFSTQRKKVKKMPFKLNILSFLGFPILISLAIYLALDSSTSTFSYLSSAYHSSFSQITFFSFDLLADFNRQTLKGSMLFVIEIKVKVFKTLYLDMNDQNISSIHLINNLTKTFVANFYIHNRTDNLKDQLDVGERLTIDLPSDFFEYGNISIQNSQFTLIIYYETSRNRNGRGINWLLPTQTFSQKFPFFYTYCKPVKCRSFAPIHDSLELSSTFSARVTVPFPMKVAIAAAQTEILYNVDIHEKLDNFTSPFDSLDYSNWTTYVFSQNSNTTAYLLNIAIGVFEESADFQEFSLLAEKEVMDNSTQALKNISFYLKCMKEILTVKLPFEHLKIFIMPMAFMESFSLGPTLVFLSFSKIFVEDPEISFVKMIFLYYFGVGKVPGDWSDWYLVSGFSHYLSYKIKKKINVSWSTLSMNFTIKRLEDVYKNLCRNDEFCLLTELQPNLNGINTNSFEDLIVPEYKGSYFFYFLETKLNGTNDKLGSELFLNFTNGILHDSNKNPLSTYTGTNNDFMRCFVIFIQNITNNEKSIEIRKLIKWMFWWKEREWRMLASPPRFESALIEQVAEFAEEIVNKSVINEKSAEIFKGYLPEAKEYYIDLIINSEKFDENKVKKMDFYYNLSNSGCVLRQKFLVLKINWYNLGENEEEIQRDFEEIVKKCGRKDVLEEVFGKLHEKNSSLAGKVWGMNEKFMHPFISDSLKLMLPSKSNRILQTITENKIKAKLFVNKFRKK